jgi:hypothetical protein
LGPIDEFSSQALLNDVLSAHETLPMTPFEPPLTTEDNFEEEELMGFGFGLDDIVDSTDTMKNATAWNSLPVASATNAEVGGSWTEAAEERRNQQKINATMEIHRVSQQVMRFRSLLLIALSRRDSRKHESVMFCRINVICTLSKKTWRFCVKRRGGRENPRDQNSI